MIDKRFVTWCRLRESIFFGNGDAGKDQIESAGSEARAAVIFQDKEQPCRVYYIDFAFGQETRGGLLHARAVDFRRMPSPRDFGSSFTSGIGGSMQSFVAKLPSDAMIETTVKRNKEDNSMSYPPTGRVWKQYSWSITNSAEAGWSRLNALDFIRNNYCGGLPEVRGY